MVVAIGMAFMLGACGGSTEDAPGGSTTVPQNSTTQGQASTTNPEDTPTTSTISTDEQEVATIDPPIELSGSSWVITEYQYRPSNTGIVNTVGEEAFIDLSEDGTLTGHNGCNEFAGTWETTGPYYDYDDAAEAFEDKIDGQPISIEAELTTSNQCSGFVGEQDSDLMGALTSTDLWFAGSAPGDQENGLTLRSNDGNIFVDPR
jgi:hypothetical protein